VLSLLRQINKVGSRRRCGRGQIHQPPLAALLPVVTSLPLLSSAAMPVTQRLRLWYRRLGRRGAAAGAAAFAAALVAAAFLLTPSRDASARGNTASYASYGHRLPTLVDLTLVDGAKEKGAVCLDGTPPGYHWLPGFGEGSDKWLVHLEVMSICLCSISVCSCASTEMTEDFGVDRAAGW
jgi:hypothetical protein